MSTKDGGPAFPQDDNTDWKSVADALAKGLLQAVTYLKAPSSTACFLNIDTGESEGIIEHFANILEKHPAVKCDRDVMYINQMSRVKGRKAMAKLMKEREAAKS